MNKKLFTAFSFIFFLFIALGNSKVSAAEIYTSPGDSKFTATKIEYNDSGYYAIKTYTEDWYMFQTPDTDGYTLLYFKNTGMDNYANIEVFNFLDERLVNKTNLYRYDSTYPSIKLDPGQTYYIRITKGSIGKTYVLDLDYREDEGGESKSTAATVDLNKEYLWALDGYDDYDYATFIADKTGKYQFKVKNTSVDTNIEFAIFDGITDERLYINSYIYKGDSDSKILNLEQGRIYYFYIGRGRGSLGNYVFSVNNQAVEKIILNKSILKLTAGETYELTATVEPKTAYNTSVSWATNDDQVAYVDNNGKITARKPGSTLITCTANDNNGAISVCNVIVMPNKMDKPYFSSSDSTASSVKIKWNKLNSVDGYTIYGYDAETKKWNELKSVDANTSEAVIKNIKVNGVSKNLSGGTSYSFRVAAYVLVDNVKYYGEQSDTLKVSTAPAKVKITSVTNPKGNTIKLKWNKVTGATGYKIYVKSRYYDEYYLLGRVDNGTTTTYTHNEIDTGKFTFKVSAYRTVDDVTYEGAMSNAKSVNKK